MHYNDRLPTLPIHAQYTINASSAQVWHAISAPGNLNGTHPFCKSNQVKKWNGVGSVDTIEYFNGVRLKRIFTEWTEGKGYELIIGYGKQAVAKVDWEVTAKSEQAADLIIRIHLIPSIVLKRYPKVFRSLLSKIYLVPTMKKYVESVVKGFKYHIETGQKVQPNQFGYNRMFSVRQA
ncbi:MAG: hypothetical protein HRU40_12930 [Saprospiraceae bacterium]|nr:hypothetical protein [Saprospiraceae bacterium]